MEKVFVTFSILCLLLSVDGSAVLVGCTNTPLCLSKPVFYMCSGENGPDPDDDVLRWRIRDASNGVVDFDTYNEGVDNSDTTTIATYFDTILTSSSGPMVSNITFSPVLAISNYTVQCDIVGTTAVSCFIMIADVPAAPVPNDLNFTSDTLNFFWSPSTSPCLSHYSVNVTSIEYAINTDDTSLSLPVPSTNDTEYSISVVAVDTGGRYMDPVDERTFVADVPDSVTNLTLNQTGLSIDVSWDEPPVLMFLSVLSYLIYPNVNNLNNNMTIPAPTTTYNIPGVKMGSVYTVGVAASNSLGIDTTDFASLTISIISTSVPSTSTSMSMTMTPSGSNSVPVVTSTSNSIQLTPTVIPTSSPSSGGLSSSVYIGIGVGVAVLVIVILILIIVGYLIWWKSKGEKANFDQRRDSTEPIALVDKKDHGSSPATGQPIYQEAMSSEDIQREAAPTTGELYAQPNKGSVRRPPPQPQSELATYQDPSTIQRIQAPNMEYLYAEVDKSKPQQQQAVYAQVDKDKKGGDGTVYADLDLKNTQGGPVTGSNPANVIYSDVHNN